MDGGAGRGLPSGAGPIVERPVLALDGRGRLGRFHGAAVRYHAQIHAARPLGRPGARRRGRTEVARGLARLHRRPPLDGHLGPKHAQPLTGQAQLGPARVDGLELPRRARGHVLDLGLVDAPLGHPLHRRPGRAPPAGRPGRVAAAARIVGVAEQRPGARPADRMVVHLAVAEVVPADEGPVAVVHRVVGPAVPVVVAGQQRGPAGIDSGVTPDHPGRPPDPSRHPDPADRVQVGPASIVERGPAPGEARRPGPAVLGVGPLAVGVRPPADRHARGLPGPTVLRRPQPFAVRRQLVVEIAGVHLGLGSGCAGLGVAGVLLVQPLVLVAAVLGIGIAFEGPVLGAGGRNPGRQQKTGAEQGEGQSFASHGRLLVQAAYTQERCQTKTLVFAFISRCCAIPRRALGRWMSKRNSRHSSIGGRADYCWYFFSLRQRVL